jgi:hypothetical protein
LEYQIAVAKSSTSVEDLRVLAYNRDIAVRKAVYANPFFPAEAKISALQKGAGTRDSLLKTLTSRQIQQVLSSTEALRRRTLCGIRHWLPEHLALMAAEGLPLKPRSRVKLYDKKLAFCRGLIADVGETTIDDDLLTGTDEERRFKIAVHFPEYAQAWLESYGLHAPSPQEYCTEFLGFLPEPEAKPVKEKREKGRPRKVTVPGNTPAPGITPAPPTTSEKIAIAEIIQPIRVPSIPINFYEEICLDDELLAEKYDFSERVQYAKAAKLEAEKHLGYTVAKAFKLLKEEAAEWPWEREYRGPLDRTYTIKGNLPPLLSRGVALIRSRITLKHGTDHPLVKALEKAEAGVHKANFGLMKARTDTKHKKVRVKRVSPSRDAKPYELELLETEIRRPRRKRIIRGELTLEGAMLHLFDTVDSNDRQGKRVSLRTESRSRVRYNGRPFGEIYMDGTTRVKAGARAAKKYLRDLAKWTDDPALLEAISRNEIREVTTVLHNPACPDSVYSFCLRSEVDEVYRICSIMVTAKEDIEYCIKRGGHLMALRSAPYEDNKSFGNPLAIRAGTSRYLKWVYGEKPPVPEGFTYKEVEDVVEL